MSSTHSLDGIQRHTNSQHLTLPVSDGWRVGPCHRFPLVTCWPLVHATPGYVLCLRQGLCEETGSLKTPVTWAFRQGSAG